MPEIKNTFLKGRMNKDLDERLLEDGEYRDAQNVSVTGSESGNSGSIENVRGNVELTDFGLNDRGLEIIGTYVDNRNDRIFAFLTNYNDSSPNALDNFASTNSSHYICVYDLNSGQAMTLVKGRFLNFSKTHPILGVNLIEDLLFWTDNRNQPRKINVETAIGKSSDIDTDPHYDKEENISVAKYYPYKPMRLYKQDTAKSLNTYLANLASSVTQGVTGATPDTYTRKEFIYSGGSAVAYGAYEIIIGASDEVISIRPSRVRPTNTGISVGDTLTFSGAIFGSSTDLIVTIQEKDLNQISTMYDVASENLPTYLEFEMTYDPAGGETEDVEVVFGGTTAELEAFIDSTLYVKKPDGSYSLNHGSGYKLESVDTTTVEAGTTHRLKFVDRYSFNNFQNIPFETGDTLVIGANPYYDADSEVNKYLLSDKFPRFSYRYKYEDNEYSLIAPFTQVAFSPKQDGYFMGDEDMIDRDEQNALKSTVVSHMENKVNQIEFQIDLPEGIAEAKDLEKELKIKEIEILMKESDEPAIKVVDSLKPFDLSQRSDNTVQYTFNSAKAIKTLPEEEVTRVYDKVPVRAATQETIGNRVVYGNFVPFHTSPEEIEYTVSVGEKKAQAEGLEYFTRREYPNHTLKDNRSYQVGIVLADKFGRQSDVILSKNSTVFNPYRDSDLSLLNAAGDIKDIFAGKSLRFTLDSPIPDVYYKEGYPNLYDADTNPLGWYSYKVVVKQQEQSYYNAYIPTILNGYPQDSTAPETNQDIAHITLFSDNINKIPRDLNEVSDNDEAFRASEQIYPRVVTTSQVGGEHTAEKFDSEGIPDTVILIGEKDALGLNTYQDGAAINESPFYSIPDATKQGSNPLIGRVSTRTSIGALGGHDAIPNEVAYNDVSLNVVETKPQNSNLDIYYETTTAGLISDLNESINQDFGTQVYPVQLTPLRYYLSEDAEIGDSLSQAFYPVDYLGNEIINGSTSVIVESAKDLYGNEWKDRFSVDKQGNNSFLLKNEYNKWSARQNNGIENVINFTFRVSNTSGSRTYTNFITVKDNRISNINPVLPSTGLINFPLSGFPSFTGVGYYRGFGKEASSRSTSGAWTGWSFPPSDGNLTDNLLMTLDVGNGSLNKPYFQLNLEAVEVDFYWLFFGAWNRYNNNSQVIPPTYGIGELVDIVKRSDGKFDVKISKKLRALAVNTNKPWNQVVYRNYPDITRRAETTNYRIKLRATDCNGNWGVTDFYITFRLTPYS